MNVDSRHEYSIGCTYFSVLLIFGPAVHSGKYFSSGTCRGRERASQYEPNEGETRRTLCNLLLNTLILSKKRIIDSSGVDDALEQKLQNDTFRHAILHHKGH